VINLISRISVVGMMVGTMAFIVILSVYNGFDNLVQLLYNTFDADLVIKPATGKYLDGADPILQRVKEDPSIAAYCEIVEETVVLQYRDQPIITGIMKGIDQPFLDHSPIVNCIVQGSFSPHLGDINQAILGRGLASSLGINVHFIDPLYLHYPSRSASINMINPISSLIEEKLFPSGIFSVEQNYDAKYLFVPLSLARKMLEYTTQVTYIELRLHPDSPVRKVQARLASMVEPNGYKLLNRYQQNETLYKMMRTEKLVIYFLLLFVLLVITCNILGSIALLIIEKQEDVETLKSMGATSALIKRIFLFEGWIISFLGAVSGLLLGLLLCFLQQRFGFISMPGNFIITAYPVAVQWGDVLSVLCAVWVIGYVTARISVRLFLPNKRL
jgi:ABC-type lipoprotein release transport system permease subunit